MLYIMLFAALSNAICLNNASLLQLIWFDWSAWCHTTSCWSSLWCWRCRVTAQTTRDKRGRWKEEEEELHPLYGERGQFRDLCHPVPHVLLCVHCNSERRHLAAHYDSEGELVSHGLLELWNPTLQMATFIATGKPAHHSDMQWNPVCPVSHHYTHLIEDISQTATIWKHNDFT